jgi:trigger factor
MEVTSVFEIKKELLDTHEALLNVEIEENTVKQAMQKAARAISGKVNIPGFRRGKAPYAKVLHYVGEGSILQEAADNLIEEIYPQIIEQAGIEPYGPGALEKIDPSPLTFTIRVPLEPVVTLGDYHSLRQAWEDVVVSNEEVANVLEQVRSEHAILEALERPAQFGDEIHINVVGTVGNEVIVDEDDIEVILKEDTPFIAPGFVEALVGMNVDEEKVFTVVFPDDFREEGLRGAEANFDVKVTGIYERVLPAPDDALASTVGAFETLEDLKNDINARLLEAKEHQAKEAYHDSLIAALVAQSEVQYPPAMVEHKLDDMIENAKNRTQRERHMELKDALQLDGVTLEQFREQLTPQAETDIKRSLVLSKFATEQNIQVSDDEVVQEYNNFMTSIGQAEHIGDERFKLDSPLGRNFRLTVLGRKTLDQLEKIGRGEVDTASPTLEAVSVPEETIVEPETTLTIEEAEPSTLEEDAAQA